MPPLPSPGLVLRASWSVSDESGVPAGSRIYLSYHGSPPDQGAVNAVATGIAAAWATNLAPMVATTDTLDLVEVQDLSSDLGLVGSATPSDAGTRSGTAMPASVAANVQHIIGRHYRGGKPKTFVRAGVIGDLHATSTNDWSAAFISAMTTAWQAYVAEILGISGGNLSNIVNVSFYSGFTSVLNPVTGRTRDVPKQRDTPIVDVVTDALVHAKLGSQRRRLN
jgi:hypothetical protein